MNFQKILLLSFAVAAFNASATTSVVQPTKEQMAEALLKEKLSVGNTVLYDKNMYTVSKFDITENSGVYDISLKLKRPFTRSGITLADECVNIKAKKRVEPIGPTPNNSKADAVRNIEVSRYWDPRVSVGLVGAWVVAGLASIL